MIELALMLRSIQSSFLVYKLTMAMQFSFEYCIDPKEHKSEEEIKAIAVEGASGQSSSQMLCKMEEYHLNIENVN